MGRLVAAALAALVLAGMAAASTAAVPVEIVGTYEGFLGIGPGSRDPGRWVLQIGPGGTVRVFTPTGWVIVKGKVSVSGDRITFPGERARGACAAAATYRYTLKGRTLSFTRVNDTCRARIFRFTSTTWKRFKDYFPVVIVVRK